MFVCFICFLDSPLALLQQNSSGLCEVNVEVANLDNGQLHFTKRPPSIQPAEDAIKGALDRARKKSKFGQNSLLKSI